MQRFISSAMAAGFQALRKSACNVSGLFIEASVTVPFVAPGVNRSASVSCGSCTGWAASHT